MSNYTDFLGIIKSKISNVADRVYLEKAPQGATFPFVTYRIQDSLNENENCREDFLFLVDVWGKQDNTTTVDDLQYNIGLELNRFVYPASTSITFHSYLVNRLMLLDSDESIKRRQLQFIVKTYII